MMPPPISPPITVMPSACTVLEIPSWVSPSAILAIRSLSLTRNSSAPRSTVTPSAQAAAMRMAGSSSIARGTSSTGMSIPLSGAERILRSATGSPPTSRSLLDSMSAPMAFRILITPSRVGLMPTCSSTRSDPSAIDAPTIKKAAEDISAGISTLVPCRVPPPSRPMEPDSTSTA